MNPKVGVAYVKCEAILKELTDHQRDVLMANLVALLGRGLGT